MADMKLQTNIKYVVKGNELRLVSKRSGNLVLKVNPYGHKLYHVFRAATNLDSKALLKWFKKVLKKGDIKIIVTKTMCSAIVGNVCFRYITKGKEQFVIKYKDDNGLLIRVRENEAELKISSGGKIVSTKAKVDPNLSRKTAEELRDYVLWLDRVLKF